MKIKLLASISFLLIGFSLFSQNNSLGSSDADAKKILDQVSAKIKSYKSVQASFSLSIVDAKGDPQGSKKGIVFMKGDKYKVSITGQEIYCDGKNVWTYDKSSNEVTLTKFDPSMSGMSPQKLLTNFYDKDFLYKLNGDQKIAGKTVQEIEMTPVDKTKNFYKIYLYVDKVSKTVSSGKMLDKSGNKYIYNISNIRGNPPVTDASFVFDKSKYPGVEVVNLSE